MNKLSFCVAATALAVGLTATQASADWSETFTNGSNGSYDQEWTISALGGSAAQSIADGHLELTGSAFVALGLVTSEAFSDVVVSGWVNAGGTGSGQFSAQTDHLLLARFDGGSGYGLFVNYELESISVGVARIASYEQAAGAESGKFIDGVDADTDVRLWAELSVYGETNPVLTARVFDTPGGTLLESISWADTSGTPYLSGYSGFAAVPNATGGSYVGSFDSITSVVPEPTALLLLAGGALMMASRRRPAGA